MATIARQIERIQAATAFLRSIITENWAVTDIDTTRLDDIAARYSEIPVISGEVFIPIQIETDGQTTVAASEPLTNGYYKGVSIKPFVTVENVQDIIINVENRVETITTVSGIIEPKKVFNEDGTINLAESYNYLQSVSYTVKRATMPTRVKSYGMGSVTINIPESGWISTQDYTITGNEALVKIDGNTITTSPANPLKLSSTQTRTITIDSGIRNTAVSIDIPPVTSCLDGTAKEEDIVAGKTAWTASGRIIGNVPDKRNTDTPAELVDTTSGTLIIKPEPGCYDDNSTISTSITVGEATYTLTGHELVAEFEITPSSDEDENETTYLTKVKINNGVIYSALAAI